MPYKDLAQAQLWNRNRMRANRHGRNWRRTYFDYDGICARCGSPERLEFHEPFGEDKTNGGMPKLQRRVPLCIDCHADEPGHCFPKSRARPSLYTEDISAEIEAMGYAAWTAKYIEGASHA